MDDYEKPGDRYTTSMVTEIATTLTATHDKYVPVGDVCRICGGYIWVMAFRGDGACCVEHLKDRA